jgi:pyruvate formate lyase activating enzyme
MEDLESTPMKVLDRAYEIGKEAGLRYVYLGNVGVGNNTYCYECHHLLIERLGYSIKEHRIRDGRCPHCGSQIGGVGL